MNKMWGLDQHTWYALLCSTGSQVRNSYMLCYYLLLWTSWLYIWNKWTNLDCVSQNHREPKLTVETLLPIFSTIYLGLRCFWENQALLCNALCKRYPMRVVELKSLCCSMYLHSLTCIEYFLGENWINWSIASHSFETFWDIVEISSETHVRFLRSRLHKQNKYDFNF